MFTFFSSVPARLNIAIMMFSGSWVSYMLRVNMSVNIIAMVSRNSNTTSVKSECDALENKTSTFYDDNFLISREWRQREGLATFAWTEGQQAYVLSSYFWGYAITCLVGGRVVELVGPRLLIFSTTLLSAVLSMLSPQAAQIHYMALVVVRFVIGLAAGFIFPALHDLIARWAPPNEKSKFVSTLQGGCVGTVFTWSLSGLLIERFGWDYAFYVAGLLVVVWCMAWWYLVYDSPLEHPRISESEKKYILEVIGNKVDQISKKRIVPPYKSILTSSPFLAMIILHYGGVWGVYFIMTAAPKYVSSALGFKLSSTGILASLPYLARMIFSVIFGAIGDKIVKMNIVSITFIRKFFCIFSHVIPGLLLIALGYTGCSPILSIVLITFSLGINGSATITNLINHQDLAPNFAATMYGIANGIGNTAGFLTPLVTAHFTKNGNGFAEWRPVFLTGASLYIGAAIYFVIFGSGVTQSWNYVTSVEEHADKDCKGIDTKSEAVVTISAKTV